MELLNRIGAHNVEAGMSLGERSDGRPINLGRVQHLRGLVKV
jgi:hypothetical protein